MKYLFLFLLTIALTSCSLLGRYITAKEFGADYPFTVDGYLECEPPGAIVFKGGGKAYAVNGTAENKGYPKIDPIWKADPTSPGSKINISDVIAEGRKLCKP